MSIYMWIGLILYMVDQVVLIYELVVKRRSFNEFTEEFYGFDYENRKAFFVAFCILKLGFLLILWPVGIVAGFLIGYTAKDRLSK